jgi:hypothetical protein
MATVPIISWQEDEIQKSNPQAEAAELVKREALAITVSDEPSLLHAVDFAKRIKAKAKEVADYWKPLKDSAYKVHRALTAREAELLAPLAEAESHLKRGISAYQAEQERIRREEQRRLEEESRRKAEEERESLLLQIEDAGATAEEVAAVANMPLAVAPVMVAAPVAKPAGLSVRETWKAAVIDKAALVRYVAANPNMLHLLAVDQPALNALAKAMKSAGSIPGVKFYAETTAALRA